MENTHITSPGPFSDNLPTPPASSVAPSTHGPPLPRPRKHPLPPGGAKESSLIFYLENALTNISKRVQNRHVNELLRGELKGYPTFVEYAKDIDGLVDVIWVTNSLNLQIPYLITFAVSIIDTLPLYPPAPLATFNLLEKLDSAFAALLTGRDPETDEPLPGVADHRGVSTTDKVRIKGVVERARIVVTRVLEGVEGEEPMDVDEGAEGGDDTVGKRTAMERERGEQGMVSFEGFEDNEDDDWEERHVAGIFEKTLGELGDVLGGEPIGIVTDE